MRVMAFEARLTRAIALGLLAAACGGGAKNVDLTQTAPPTVASAGPPVAPPPAAPSAAAAVDGAYQLPVASSAVPLPARAIGFVFVGADGSLRVGRDAAFADARWVAGVAAVAEALGHRRPSAPDADAQAGEGGHHAVAERADLGAIRIVVVMDRAAPAELAVRLADSLPEPIVLAVDGGALPFAIARGPVRPGHGDAALPVTLSAEQPFAHLVSQLDAAAVSGVTSVDLQVELAPRGGMPGRSAVGLAILIDQPRATRGLDPSSIRQHVHRHTTEIRECAEKHLLGDADGTVTARFVIGPGGTVLDSTASGPPGFDAVATCVARIMRAVEFPRPTGGATVDVSYPITFRPSDR